jgi:hypothetical protein
VEKRDRRLRPLEPRYQWDEIATQIHQIMQDALSAAVPGSASGTPSAGAMA